MQPQETINESAKKDSFKRIKKHMSVTHYFSLIAFALLLFTLFYLFYLSDDPYEVMGLVIILPAAGITIFILNLIGLIAYITKHKDDRVNLYCTIVMLVIGGLILLSPRILAFLVF